MPKKVQKKAAIQKVQNESRLDRARIALLEAQTSQTFSEIAIAESEAARARSREMISKDVSPVGAVKVVPSEQKSRSRVDRAQEAGNPPGYARPQIGTYENGNPIYGIGSSQSTSIEEDIGAWWRWARGKARRNARRRADKYIWRKKR